MEVPRRACRPEIFMVDQTIQAKDSEQRYPSQRALLDGHGYGHDL